MKILMNTGKWEKLTIAIKVLSTAQCSFKSLTLRKLQQEKCNKRQITLSGKLDSIKILIIKLSLLMQKIIFF